MRQIEQLHSCTRSSAGASTSKATSPQWQPPLWVTCLSMGATRIKSARSYISEP